MDKKHSLKDINIEKFYFLSLLLYTRQLQYSSKTCEHEEGARTTKMSRKRRFITRDTIIDSLFINFKLNSYLPKKLALFASIKVLKNDK